MATSPFTVRTRFAPSPSGHLHVGGARTALFCWAYARKRGGRFILRIEDTDQKRSSDAAGMAFLEDLRWLGIDWDEGPEFEGCGGGEAGPYFQSRRLDIYQTFIKQLIEAGHAYRAFESPEELAAMRAEAMKERRKFRYNRAALELDAATVEQYLEEGREFVVRLKVRAGSVEFHDEVRGDMSIACEELDDFVIQKADGYPTYHFAVVVDDELMGVTHVLRAEEHLSNTPRHILLQEALGFRRPVYAHVSVITNPDGSKMSKRDKDKAVRRAVRERGIDAPPTSTITRERWDWWLSAKDHQLDPSEAESLASVLGIHLPEINVDDFRRNGYLPKALLNYLALLGWNPGGDIEHFDMSFFIERFDFDRVIKSAAKFDREKLLAFNHDAIQALDASEWLAHLRDHAERYHPEFPNALGESRFGMFAACNQSRSKTLDDPFRSDRFFVVDDEAITYEASKGIRKALLNGEPAGYEHLESLLSLLETVEDWTPAAIEEVVHEYAETHAGGKLGKVAQPLRIAVTGGTVSPAIFDTLAILGKRSTLARIRRCLGQRQQLLAAAE